MCMPVGFTCTSTKCFNACTNKKLQTFRTRELLTLRAHKTYLSTCTKLFLLALNYLSTHLVQAIREQLYCQKNIGPSSGALVKGKHQTGIRNLKLSKDMPEVFSLSLPSRSCSLVFSIHAIDITCRKNTNVDFCKGAIFNVLKKFNSKMFHMLSASQSYHLACLCNYLVRYLVRCSCSLCVLSNVSISDVTRSETSMQLFAMHWKGCRFCGVVILVEAQIGARRGTEGSKSACLFLVLLSSWRPKVLTMIVKQGTF